MGEVQVALWRGSSKDAGDEWHTQCPFAPPYNNPDPKAVMLTVKFDRYSFPVYYPATIPQSWTSLLGVDPSNTALRKQFLRLLDLIKEGKLHGVSHTHFTPLLQPITPTPLVYRVACCICFQHIRKSSNPPKQHF